MPKRDKGSNIDVAGELTDFAKDVGKSAVRGFGRVLAIGAGSATVGGVVGGVAAAIYGLPIVPFIIVGAVVAFVAVFAIWLLVSSDM